MVRKHDTATHQPTEEIYADLQSAYSFFNKTLFADKLPNCLITIQRKRHTFGYYSRKRWINKEGTKTDEIALNSAFFANRSIEEILATFVHEMVHQWQTHFGRPGRGRYHNKEWSDFMENIGLMPTNTGKPGGRQTGDQMTHYIIQDGLFDKSCRSLVNKSYRIRWYDRYPDAPIISRGGNNTVDVDLIKRLELDEFEVHDITTPSNKSNRIKYTCSLCDLNVWGRPNLNIACVDCNSVLDSC